MKTNYFFSWVLVIGILSGCGQGKQSSSITQEKIESPPKSSSADMLWKVFQEPPMETRASAYWLWKGDLTADEMGRQLRLFKDAGLGGARIHPWRQCNPAYLSPEWLKLLRAASDAARKEGMSLDMTATAYYPFAFSGDWVSEAEGLHKAKLETFHVEGPKKFLLPEKGSANGNILLAQLARETASQVEEMRDVTAELTKLGSTGVDVPPGKHTIRVVRLLKNYMPYPGRIPDHFNPRAIENYLKGFADRVAPALGGKLSNSFRALFCESTEQLGEANWTPDLPAKFKRRYGYDLMPYLPLVLNIDDDQKGTVAIDHSPLNDTIVRVRYDYNRLLVDLFLDALPRTFHRWCHENGVLSQWQAYGGPWNYGLEDGYRIVDLPEGNNWLFSVSGDEDYHTWPVQQKYASSGAHQTGRRIISNEAMTTSMQGGKFEATLDLIKRADDFQLICGITSHFLTLVVYSPSNEPFPGRPAPTNNLFGWGTHFSEHNTWWTYMRRWMDYNARLNAIFQSSRPVARVALLFHTSDVWGEAGLNRRSFAIDQPWTHQVWRWISQNGTNADYVSDQVLQQSTFGDGKINFGPMRYDALIVLGARTLVPATAEALDRYVRAGGRIVFVGDIPNSSSGLKDASDNDRKVRGIVQNLLRDFPQSVIHRNHPGSVPIAPVPWLDLLKQWRSSTTPETCLAWTDQLLTDLHIERSVRFKKPPVGLYQIHYRHDDGRDLYFFANTTGSDITASAAFPLAGKRMERWDPETGTRSAFPVDKEGRALLVLPPAHSLLLVTAKGESSVATVRSAPSKSVVAQEIAGPWSVTFKPANGAAFEIAQFKLMGLHMSQEDRLQRFSGRAIYRCRFEWNKPAGDTVFLKLGKVPNCLTEVAMNGQHLGVRWYGRHDYFVPASALRQGTNELEVTVVTTLFNCLQATSEKAKPSQKLEPSGLLGPVTIQTSVL